MLLLSGKVTVYATTHEEASLRPSPSDPVSWTTAEEEEEEEEEASDLRLESVTLVMATPTHGT